MCLQQNWFGISNKKHRHDLKTLYKQKAAGICKLQYVSPATKWCSVEHNHRERPTSVRFPELKYNWGLKASIFTVLMYFRKYNKCQWDPWWSPLPGLHGLRQGTAHLIQLFNLSLRLFLTGLRQVCWPALEQSLPWNAEPRPRRVRWGDSGVSAVESYSSGSCFYGTSDFSLWAFRRIFISVSWM